MPRQSRFIIDLAHLEHKLTQLSLLAGPRKTMAVVKANAYGHGALGCAKALEDVINAFAVALTEEAIALREAGITKPILVLQGPHSSDDLTDIYHYCLWPALSNRQQIHWLRDQTPDLEHVWLKVDTGMHRLGFDPHEVGEINTVLTAMGIQHITLMSHLAEAEDSDSTLSHRQIHRWQNLLERNTG